MPPPFNIDTTSPADSQVVSQFPATERAHRTTLENMWNTEHYEGTARHNIGAGTPTARDLAITAPEVGNIWFETTAGGVPLALNRHDGTNWIRFPFGFVGMIALAARDYSSIPDGWVPCDGRSLAQATHPDLYAVLDNAIWDTWDGQSGPGGGNFRVPKLNGFITVGLDPAGDTDYDTLGDPVGDTQGEDAKTKSDKVLNTNIEEFTQSTETDGDHEHGMGIYNAQTGGSLVHALGMRANTSTISTLPYSYVYGRTSGLQNFWARAANVAGGGGVDPRHSHVAVVGTVGATPIDKRQPFCVLGYFIYSGVDA